MSPHERVTRASRREPEWATEDGPDGELHPQPTESCRRPQRSLVNAKVTCEFIE
jgi:hypothetical protein